MEQSNTKHQTTTFTSEARFFAQPYDISANGFFFADGEDYLTKVKACKNAYGQPVEEFEIQFIDGNDLNAELFKALDISQATILSFIDKLDIWEDHQKKHLIVAVGECGYNFDAETGDPDDFDVILYTDMKLSDLAYQFVDESLFGDIPEHLTNYIDYDAIARDLGHDYSEITIAGEVCCYACH